MGPAGVKVSKGAVLGIMIKPSSLREELLMLLRTIASIAASVIIGVACIATVSTDTFAAPAGTTRLSSCGPGMIRINGVCVDRTTVHRKCERWRHGACVHYRYY